MSENTVVTNATSRIARTIQSVSWRTIILALITIGTFFAMSEEEVQQYDIASMGMVPTGLHTVGAPPPLPPLPAGGHVFEATLTPINPIPIGNDLSASYYPTSVYYSTGHATDTREFLKTNYSTSMRTRDVPALVRRVTTTVREYEGRIDEESASPTAGFVSFAVPAQSYEQFRASLERLVNHRFLTVHIQSSNLLPQKQNIEDTQKQIDTTVANYEKDKQTLASAHVSTVKILQSQIDAHEAQLTALSAQENTYDVRIQIQSTLDDLAIFKQQLADENVTYDAQLKSLDRSIADAQNWRDTLVQQERQLREEVAMVDGTVSIEWISIRDMVRAYVPDYAIPAIFAVLTVISYWWDRRRAAATISTTV